MDQVIFEARGVAYAYPRARATVVDGVDLRVGAGELVGIVGPNGSGKTTLLRILLGVLPPTVGSARILERPASEWDRRALARVVGVVTQREEPAFPLKVEESVLLGRYPHLRPLAAPGPSDHAAVSRALRQCDVDALRGRWIDTLSGGEWQRVRIARALAQEPRALVLDEPTANLDVRHEMEVFELVAGLVRNEQLAGLLVTHHVNLAARFVDRLVVMDGGRAASTGSPEAVLHRDLLEDVFGCPVDLIRWRGVPQLIPLRHGEHHDA